MPFGAAGTVVKGTGTTCDVPVPSGVAAGTLVKIIIYLQVADAVTSDDFVQKYDISTSPTTRGGFRVLWKRATASDAGTYTVNWTNSSLFEAWAVVHNGIHSNGDPFETANSSQASSSTATTIGTNPITNTFPCDVCCVYSNHATNAGGWTPEASQTERFDDGANPPGHLMMSSTDSVSPGTQGTKVATLVGTTGGSFPKAMIYGLRTATAPEAPTITGNATASHDAIDATWTYSATSDSVASVEVRINGGTPIALGAVTSYQFTGLSPETIYTIEVRGINSVGTGPWSNAKIVLTGSTVSGVTRRYFCSDSSWTPPAGVTSVKRLIIGGGGSGGSGGNSGGGGGAGGVDEDSAEVVTPGTPIAITVGEGGLAVAGSSGQGNPGGSSSFGSTSVDGGGYGGAAAGSVVNGGPGASGGGGGGTGGGGASALGGTASGNGTGNNGGNGFVTTTNGHTRAGGGGGGASSVGTAASSQNGGEGGEGLDFSADYGTLFGDSGKVAAGGGGGRNNTSGNGTVGLGGVVGNGGDGGFSNTVAESAPHTTGSGGGGGGLGQPSGAGGDGIVVLIFEEAGEEPEQQAYWGLLAS